MPKQPAASAGEQVRRIAWSMVCALPLCGLTAGAWAQSVPAGLRACTAETDSARRLACYDREMARLPRPSAPPGPSAQPGPAAQPGPSGPILSAQPGPPALAAGAPAPSAASAEHHSSPWNIFRADHSSNVTAHVASLDRWPDAMVLHLDNGQVWEQIGRASGDLSLEVGDSVTIEKHLGSYWLSSAHVSDMQVRLKSQ